MHQGLVVPIHRCDETQPSTFDSVPCWIDEDAEWTWGHWTGTEWMEVDGEVSWTIEPTYWIALPVPPFGKEKA